MTILDFLALTNGIGAMLLVWQCLACHKRASGVVKFAIDCVLAICAGVLALRLADFSFSPPYEHVAIVGRSLFTLILIPVSVLIHQAARSR
ncbi:MAG TPA: hypothetical protein VFM75_12820 [Modicisalibacter sp.]|nr:hypothetical protein [Modicisalibacter sp.]